MYPAKSDAVKEHTGNTKHSQLEIDVSEFANATLWKTVISHLRAFAVHRVAHQGRRARRSLEFSQPYVPATTPGRRIHSVCMQDRMALTSVYTVRPAG